MQALINTDWVHFFYLSLPITVLLIAACLIVGGAIFLGKWQHRVTVGITFISLITSFGLSWSGWLEAKSTTIQMFLFDPFSYLFFMIFALTGIFTLFISFRYLQKFQSEYPEYYALILFALVGMNCMAAAADVILLFVGLEIMSIAVYVLAGFHRSKKKSIEAALKYFLNGAFASGFLLLGIAFLYGANGSTDLNLIFQNQGNLWVAEQRLFGLLGFGLLLVGVGFKIAVVPFHAWAADVYEGAPVTITSFMATAVKAAGIAVFLRLSWAFFQFEPVLFQKIIWVGAVLTMSLGNIAALGQKSLKRMLAYSSIAHAGYLLVPLTVYATNNALVTSSLLFYLIAYVLMTTGAFAVIVALTKQNQEHFQIGDLAGMGSSKPFVAAAFTIFMLSLAGFPPTVGFFGKYFLFVPVIQAGDILLIVIALINSVISVYYYLRPVVVIYFGGHKKAPTPDMSRAIIFVLVISLLGVGYFGLFPNQLLELTLQTMVR